MITQKTILILSILLFTGCSFINFSANYYDPPAHYQTDILVMWDKMKRQLPLKYEYKVVFISERDSNRLNGIPAISENMVLMPDDFVRYVYQNYYDDRFKIFSSVIVHELSHREFNLESKPPGVHFETDVRAIALLGGDLRTAETFHKSLRVMKDYWFARKGVAGHTLNATWNAVNITSVALGGPGIIADWFATDLEERMNLIAKHYHLSSRKPFRRSKEY